MLYGTDRVGCGNCVPSVEENSTHKSDMEKTEHLINLKTNRHGN